MINSRVVGVVRLALALFQIYAEIKGVDSVGVRKKNSLKAVMLSLALLLVAVLSGFISLQVLLFVYLMSLSLSLINIGVLVVLCNLLIVVSLGFWHQHSKKQIASLKGESRLPILFNELIVLISSMKSDKSAR